MSINNNILEILSEKDINVRDLYLKFSQINDRVSKIIFYRMINGLCAFSLEEVEQVATCLEVPVERLLREDDNHTYEELDPEIQNSFNFIEELNFLEEWTVLKEK